MDFHGAFHFALAFAVFDGVALVVFGFAFAQADFAFDPAILPVQIKGHQSETLLFDLASQAFDLIFFEQQFPGAAGFGVDVGGCGRFRAAVF